MSIEEKESLRDKLFLNPWFHLGGFTISVLAIMIALVILAERRDLGSLTKRVVPSVLAAIFYWAIVFECCQYLGPTSFEKATGKRVGSRSHMFILGSLVAVGGMLGAGVALLFPASAIGLTIRIVGVMVGAPAGAMITMKMLSRF